MKASTRARFGRIVRERRLELGMTQDDVTAAGGPSDTTQTRVENAEGVEPNSTTVNRYDRALRWTAGSAARVWQGGYPDPLPEPNFRPARTTAAPLKLGPMEVPVSLEQLIELLEIFNSLCTAAEDAPDNEPLQRSVKDMRGWVSALTGTWVTDVLERNYNASNEIPLMIEFAFSGHLAAPVDLAAPDAEERLYRRWLVGRTDGIPEELAAQFDERLARKGAPT